MQWTIEVLPDPAAKKTARAQKTAKKPRPAKTRVKKAPAAPPTIEPAPSVRIAPPAVPLAPAQRATWLRAIVPLAAVALVVAAVAVPRRSPAPPSAATGAQPESRDVAAAVVPAAPRIAPTRELAAASVAPAASPVVVWPRPVNEPPKNPAARPAATRATRSTTSSAVVVPAAPAADSPRHEEPAAKPSEPEAPASAAAASTASTGPAPVTITGCLEVSTDGDTFRLSDVEGADAPKSRSWRTGFFKKRPAPVVLVEPPDRQALTANVGHRVAATGQLANRELKLNALHVVGSSCN